jgi:hypothetical protein
MATPYNYNPWAYNPQNPYGVQQQMAQQNTGITFAFIDGGENGAKSFPVQPGTTAILFDRVDPIFFFKTVDLSGMPAPLRKCTYTEETPTPPSNPDSVTKKDLEDLYGRIMTEINKPKNQNGGYVKKHEPKEG